MKIEGTSEERLRALASALRDEELHKELNFKFDMARDFESYNCGTVGCAYGLTQLLRNERGKHLEGFCEYFERTYFIDNHTAERLFNMCYDSDGDHIPYSMITRFDVANAIEHFLETGEAVYPTIGAKE